MIQNAMAKKVIANFTSITLDESGERKLSEFNLHPAVGKGVRFLRDVFPGQTIGAALEQTANWVDNVGSFFDASHPIVQVTAKLFPALPIQDMADALERDPEAFRRDVKEQLPSLISGMAINHLTPEPSFELVRCRSCSQAFEVSGPGEQCPFCGE